MRRRLNLLAALMALTYDAAFRAYVKFGTDRQTNVSTHTDRNSNSKNEHELMLIRRVAAQDRNALTELYQNYYPRLFKFIFRLNASFEETEEVVNDVMLLVWKNAGDFRGASKVSTWIFGIAYRQSMKRIGKMKKRFDWFSSVDEIPIDDNSSIETEDWVQSALQTLPMSQRLTVTLVFYLGLTYEETANVADCPVNTVKTRMFHARRKLKTILQASAEAVTDLESK